MNKLIIFLLLPLSIIACKAQLRHKDQMEFGFKGNIKLVVKRVYSNPILKGDTTKPDINQLITTYSYFFNPTGNIDSTKTEYTFPSGESNGYKTIYKFKNSQKSEWIALNEDAEKLLTGKISWTSDKEYVERVFDASGNSKYETTTILNDSFRIIKTKIKAFDGLGITIQDDIQEFELDKQLNTVFYKTKHKASGQTEMTDYKYLKTDNLGNPIELLIIKREKGTITLIRLEYIYYPH